MADLGTFTEDTRPRALEVTFFADKERTQPFDLTGYVADFSAYRRGGNNPAGLGTGTLTFAADRTTGVVIYQWDSADLSEPGTYVGQTWIRSADSTHVEASDEITWRVERRTPQPAFV